MQEFKHLEQSSSLGCSYPYYFRDSVTGQFVIEPNINEVISKFGNNFEIDAAAVAEILSTNYIFGDRTIVKGINRSPWLSNLNTDKTEWEYQELMDHSECFFDRSDIARNLFNLICAEIKLYIRDSHKVGILLSGGMDSRIVAGCLDYVCKSGEVGLKKITAYTWGDEDSRDVVYAQEIANRLNWNWKHYRVNDTDLWDNFVLSGLRGAEYSGIHLHAIPKIKKDLDVDVVLGGSYGDSIGRGEYSGKKVSNLVPLEKKLHNFGSFLKDSVYRKVLQSMQDDLQAYHIQFPRKKTYQKLELDYQIHYMRRNLNSCMEILNESVPFYQVFTHNRVYSYMWTIHPSLRNDSIYHEMFELFPTILSDIPWARTGVRYMEKGTPDLFNKSHHSYYSYIQNNLMSNIELRIFGGRLESLGIFNLKAIRSILKMVKLNPDFNKDYLEKITWLVSLDFFIEAYESDIGKTWHPNKITDDLNARVFTPIDYWRIHTLRKWNKKLRK